MPLTAVVLDSLPWTKGTQVYWVRRPRRISGSPGFLWAAVQCRRQLGRISTLLSSGLTAPPRLRPTPLKSAFTLCGDKGLFGWWCDWESADTYLVKAHPKAKPFLTFAWQSSPAQAVAPWGWQASGHHLIQTHKTPVIGKGHRLLTRTAKGT